MGIIGEMYILVPMHICNGNFLGGQRPLVPLLLLGPPFFYYSFWSTTLLTGMTGISLHMQWPLTSQLHGSVSQREQLDVMGKLTKTKRSHVLVCTMQ
jgi:hypothetical protein